MDVAGRLDRFPLPDEVRDSIAAGVESAVDTLRYAPEPFSAIVGIALLSVLLDFVWKRARDRGEGGGAGGKAGRALRGGLVEGETGVCDLTRGRTHGRASATPAC